jgi:hypothetical protein
MTLYSGETILIKHTASFDGVPMTDADVQTVTIVIYNSALQIVEEETPMVWDAAKVRWTHSWDTSPTGATPTYLPAGTYRIKIYIRSIDGAENWEFGKVRLKVNPV